MTQTAESGTRTMQLQGHLTPADKEESDYRLLPFEIPVGIQRLRVRYDYTNAILASQTEDIGTVLDIGLFDPRGAEPFHALGFRGWSGSARREFELTPLAATPGYLPGPLFPGTWHILLGLYRLAPQGSDYQVTIEFDPAPGGTLKETAVTSTPLLPTRGPGWYRGDLHAHTEHSDAQGTVADLAAAARARHLDYIAVTDHNTSSHLAELTTHTTPDLLLLPGEEITTYYGHANAFGITSWHEFRCRAPDDIARVIASVHEAGGLFSINHPKPGGPLWDLEQFAQADCMEVWQSLWFVRNRHALALWERLLGEGYRLVAVGGSDRHQPPLSQEHEGLGVGQPTTWVYAAELSTSGILAGIKAGHVTLSAQPDGPRVFLEADADGDGRYEVMMGDELHVSYGAALSWRCRVEGGAGQLLRLVASEHTQQVNVDRDEFEYHWEEPVTRAGYWRAELIIPDAEAPDPAALMRTALGNPIYLKVQAIP